MLGKGGVGKTSLLHRFLFDKYNFNHIPTIEDNYQQSIKVGKHTINFTILDTSGSYEFPAMRKHAIQHGDGFIIVFAFDDAASLKEAKKLYEEVTTLQPLTPVVIVGNKVDTILGGKGRLSQDETLITIKEWGGKIHYFESSAKINYNVICVFNTLLLDFKSINSKAKKNKQFSHMLSTAIISPQLSTEPLVAQKHLLQPSLLNSADNKESTKIEKTKRKRLSKLFTLKKSKKLKKKDCERL
ncbi:GTP-binding protein Di-Ras2 [Hydra vulgaris]|uniref:GTP-binding protein Di-Ras2 n=1 Tax=Hydra vulgaris TaxID=6087 RepID=A0ABM4BA77_HYDVU